MIASASAISAGTFSVGDFALFVYNMDSIGELTGFLGFLIARYKQAGVSVNRMTSLMQGAPPDDLVKNGPVYEKGDFPEVPFTTKTAAHKLDTLEVRGLTSVHESTGRGVQDISFKINRGEFVVITGRIGSGKTTLLRAMLGLLPADCRRGVLEWRARR